MRVRFKSVRTLFYFFPLLFAPYLATATLSILYCYLIPRRLCARCKSYKFAGLVDKHSAFTIRNVFREFIKNTFFINTWYSKKLTFCSIPYCPKIFFDRFDLILFKNQSNFKDKYSASLTCLIKRNYTIVKFIVEREQINFRSQSFIS